MMSELPVDVLTNDPRAREFFLARQPILDRAQDLVAYELLFRRAAIGAAEVVDDLAATAAVIEHSAALGLENVIGPALGFVNVDEAVLMSDIVQFLPADKVVLEILETVVCSAALIRRVAALAALGYTFALDDVITHSEHLRGLMPYVKLIKIDVTGMDPAHLAALTRNFLAAGKILLAEKVETVEEFDACLALGFHYFQGYYFARPNILSGKKLAASQLTLVQLIGLLANDATTEHIKRVIKQDASIGLMLLRLVNTPGIGAAKHIDSFGEALLVLGRRQLQRWLQILLYAQPGKDRNAASPLLALATTRGKLLELITEKLHPAQRAMADTAFTVGIMSLMDTLFGQPMASMLAQISVSDEVREALLSHSGFFGELLQLAESIERIEEDAELVPLLLDRLALTPEELNVLQLLAFEWSNQLSSSTRRATGGR
jgi:EAL and modified HD-GYP domain-containing signal transduction protein